jgi:hypothetical protein
MLTSKKEVPDGCYARMLTYAIRTHADGCLQVTAKLLRRTHASDAAASIVESVRAHLLQKKEVWRAGYLRCVC